MYPVRYAHLYTVCVYVYSPIQALMNLAFSKHKVLPSCVIAVTFLLVCRLCTNGKSGKAGFLFDQRVYISARAYIQMSQSSCGESNSGRSRVRCSPLTVLRKLASLTGSLSFSLSCYSMYASLFKSVKYYLQQHYDFMAPWIIISHMARKQHNFSKVVTGEMKSEEKWRLLHMAFMCKQFLRKQSQPPCKMRLERSYGVQVQKRLGVFRSRQFFFWKLTYFLALASPLQIARSA